MKWLFWEDKTFTCPDNDPSMLLTVTGVVTQTINWCGETWNLPADSGVTKEVCPIYYSKTQDWNGGVSSYQALESWRHSGGFYNRDLVLERIAFRYVFTPVYSPIQFSQIRNSIYISPTTKLRDRYGFNWPSTATTTYTYNDLGLLGSVAQPTFSDYRLTDDFFGSYNSGTITFTWAKLNDW